MTHQYKVNQIVRSIQGEGARMGIPTTFLRFSGCTLKCDFCDTDHEHGTYMELDMIRKQIQCIGADVVSLCGGEPTLQVDDQLIGMLYDLGAFVTIETNGTNPVHLGVDYVVVSPKVSSRRLVKNFGHLVVDELKYAIAAGDKLPRTLIKAHHYFISPIYNGDVAVPANIQHCADLVRNNPTDVPWRLTVQAHKVWGLV